MHFCLTQNVIKLKRITFARLRFALWSFLISVLNANKSHSIIFVDFIFIMKFCIALHLLGCPWIQSSIALPVLRFPVPYYWI